MLAWQGVTFILARMAVVDKFSAPWPEAELDSGVINCIADENFCAPGLYRPVPKCAWKTCSSALSRLWLNSWDTQCIDGVRKIPGMMGSRKGLRCVDKSMGFLQYCVVSTHLILSYLAAVGIAQARRARGRRASSELTSAVHRTSPSCTLF